MSGEATGDAGTAGEGTGAPAGAGGSPEGTGSHGDTPPAQAGRSFSQEDVDRIVQERLARDRRDRPSDDELTQLRERAAKLDEIEAASQSELEKAQARADKADADAKAAIERADRQLISAAILAAGTAQGALKPEHLHRLIDTESVTVGNDGQVTGATEAVEGFLKANPEYVGNGRPAGSADQGARSGAVHGKDQLSRADLAGMSSAEIVQAEKDGRLVEITGGKQT